MTTGRERNLLRMTQAPLDPAPSVVAAEQPARGRAGRKADALNPRRTLMRRLAREVEQISGIAITEMMEAKLARVLASVGLTELDSWVNRLHLLPGHHPEWLSLIESLTVHETFFHRDRSQLALLAAILPELVAEAARSGRNGLRLWSAGCATGEEAYTLAILALTALHDAGFAERSTEGGFVCRPSWRVEVLGTDISRLVLTQARQAVYSTEGLSAFRDLPAALQRFFPTLPKTRESGEAQLRGVLPTVRRCVRFRQFNLVTGFPPETGFDVVLCRNVLMYLTTPARAAAQSVLGAALRRGGYLLLGPTDALAEPAPFATRWGTGAVAYALRPGDE